MEDKSLSVENLSNIQFFPSNSEKGTRLPIYKKWTMGPIYLPVKSLQAVSHINLSSSSDNLRKKTFATFKDFYPSTALVGVSVCEGPACVRLEGRGRQIYLRSICKYLSKYLAKQCKYTITITNISEIYRV